MIGLTLSAAIYLITASLFFASLVMLCTTIVILAVIRYVLPEAEQSRLLAAKTIASTGIVVAASVALSQSSIAMHTLHQLLQHYFENLPLPANSTTEPILIALSIAILFTTVLIVWLVMHSHNAPNGNLRSGTALSAVQLQIISRTLEDSLNALDRELRFFDFRTKAIDPKLERLSATAMHAASQTALQVISRASEREFVVVKGEPGSGKSVMLRNLARQLLAGVANGGKVPLLLNMRDFPLTLELEQAEIVTSLRQWAKSEYRRQTGSRSNSISDEEFDQLYAEGSLVFLFDSFDENGAVGQSPHHGEFVGALSQALVEFIRTSGGCIGIVFSREFKSPTVGWIAHQTYSVRPFTDSDIKKYVTENCVSSKPLVAAIFTERIDLYAMAKSPLLLALVVDFCNGNDGRLPNSEFDIFQSYIRRRIHRALQGGMASSNKYEEALRVAKALARCLSSHQTYQIDGSNEKAIGILAQARLIRQYEGGYAFAHKRFHEYFRVCSMLDGDEAPPSIHPNHIDERRDVLNLFAQICSNNKAKVLAKAANRTLKRAYADHEETGSVKSYEAVILSLRFLRGAFRNRPNVVNKYRKNVAFIAYSLWNRADVLCQKHALEQIALLPVRNSTNLVRSSLASPFPFLKRIALSEARYISWLQPWLGRCVAAYFSRVDDIKGYIDLMQGDLRTAMINAASIDKVSFFADALMRLAMIALAVMSVFIPTPFGAGASAFLIILYLVLVFIRNREMLSFLPEWGLNPGLSGLLASNFMIAAFINMASASVSPNIELFWNREGHAWVAVSSAVLAIAMLGNNVLTRKRDQLDTLDEVGILSRDVLRMEKPGIGQIMSTLVSVSPIIVLLVASILRALSFDTAAVIGLVFLLWALSLIYTVIKGLFEESRRALRRKIERPRIEAFSRHFSGSRIQIAEALKRVKTDESRMRILKAADDKASEFFQQLRDPQNVWPNGGRPQYSPQVTSYLALLDERWWGLG
ncbi:NACHT domain-containing protein [Hyphomicrobium nitrativorans]|uniref:NACHT domain-containing protein n=1 Tax=Hyphomicrobium nitrativorans TaxID=1427356 RepID=UPI00130D9BE8|nr:NACHT domain-containing protein [Hyphomicrobium nitrativorans]